MLRFSLKCWTLLFKYESKVFAAFMRMVRTMGFASAVKVFVDEYMTKITFETECVTADEEVMGTLHDSIELLFEEKDYVGAYRKFLEYMNTAVDRYSVGTYELLLERLERARVKATLRVVA